MTPRRAAIGVITALTIATMSACTSSASAGHGAALNTPASITADGLPTDTGVASDGSTTASATTPSATATSSASPTGITLPKDTCTAAQLTVRVIRGGAVPSQEIALITFTNSSRVTCEMFGFPGVSLRAGGRQVGQPAVRSSVTAKNVRLAPGEQAEAQITDFSSCQAPLSDTVRIYPPNLTAFVDRPIQLRACRFEVDPVSHSS